MIKEFQGEYRWLSNFWEFDTPMVYQGMSFITNEHFYVAMKTKDLSIRKQVSEHPLKGLKKFGNTFPLRKDWNDIKLDVMLFGLSIVIALFLIMGWTTLGSLGILDKMLSWFV
jgi:predicted NAD-dependent protein-ADP-ribosyltransferase YbiA (DUF1768 family)